MRRKQLDQRRPLDAMPGGAGQRLAEGGESVPRAVPAALSGSGSGGW